MSEEIKVLFVIQDPNLPSSRVRVVNLLPELRGAGIKPTVFMYPKKPVDRLRLIRSIGRYDILYLQKRLINPVETKLFSHLARTFLFDFDDAIYYRPDSSKKKFASASRRLKFKYVVKNADLIIAGNRILGEYAAQYNKKVIVLPSAVETRDIPVRNHHEVTDKVIIGWVGGENNLRHLRLLSSVLRALSSEYKIELRILSSKGLDMPSVNVAHVPWKLETQEKEIAAFDIGVMPLPKNKHTEGKCGYKALQYMAAAVPPVVSEVGINGDIVIDGRNGFVAPTIDDFYHALKNLITSRELRMKMGLEARETVEKQYSISVVGDKLATLLKAVRPNCDYTRLVQSACAEQADNALSK